MKWLETIFLLLTCNSAFQSLPAEGFVPSHRIDIAKIQGTTNTDSIHFIPSIPLRLNSRENKSRYLPTFTSLNQSIGENDVNKGPDSKVQTLTNAVFKNTTKSLLFSLSQTTCGALLGPLLDTYHSSLRVLQYDQPFTLQLWSNNVEHPALITTWWVPPLFGLAGFLIGWLYILLDQWNDVPPTKTTKGAPEILVGISFFTFQYWASGILSWYDVDRTIIFILMATCAYVGYKKLDDTVSGLIVSFATAVGGPLIEVGLISWLSSSGNGGYHYVDAGETGFFPLWIVPVYFLGGPANGNLARGVWNFLDDFTSKKEKKKEVCQSCNDSRAVPCPNCDAQGYYVTYGRSVTCNCCKGRGLVICRECFANYGEDPADIGKIREMMSRFPD